MDDQLSRRTIDQRIAETEAKLARLRDRQRRLDAGRKVVLGGMLMAACRRDSSIARWTLGEIENHVQRGADQDRLKPVADELRSILAADPTETPQEPV